MSRSLVSIRTVLVAGVLTGLVAAASAATTTQVAASGPVAAATTTATATCTDGAGVVWRQKAVWGADYTDAAGVRRARIDYAGWTTNRSGILPTDSMVRSYDGAGRLLQTLIKTNHNANYYRGTVWDRRNPLNPPSSPGRAKVSIQLGVDSDGKAECAVTFIQPGTATPRPRNPVPVGVPGKWTQAFGDEFNGTALNTAKWNTLDGKLMNNVTLRKSNVSVSGGSLILKLSNSSNGGAVSSSEPNRYWGKPGFEAKIGSYTESRVYFPGDRNQPIYNFPAAWTSGHQWPSNGEHDYAEGLSGRLTANYHYGSDYHHHVANNSGPVSGTWQDAYHVYGVHRKATSADVYWDGKLIRTYQTHDSGGGHTLIFNIGKSNRRAPVLGSAGAVKVDYVRVWQR